CAVPGVRRKTITAEGVQRVKVTALVEAVLCRHMCAGRGVHHTGEITGRCIGNAKRIKQADRVSARGQGCRTAAPRETGTDYRNAPDGIRDGLLSFAVQTATQHFPFAAETGYAMHGESSLFKTTPDEAGTGKGGQCCVCVTEPGNFIKYFLAPHGLVTGRGESIQKPRINVRLTQFQHVEHIAEGEGQLHARVAETAAVKAGCSGRVVFQ